MTFPLGTLPRNITRAVLEVYPKGNACDEFWYAGLPNSFAVQRFLRTILEIIAATRHPAPAVAVASRRTPP